MALERQDKCGIPQMLTSFCCAVVSAFSYSCCHRLSHETWKTHSPCSFPCLLCGLGQVTEPNGEDNNESLLKCVGIRIDCRFETLAATGEHE